MTASPQLCARLPAQFDHSPARPGAAGFRSCLCVFGWLLLMGAETVFGYGPGTNLWKLQLDWRSLSSPAVDTSGVIYVATGQGRLDAVNPDGTVRWTYRGVSEMCASPAIAPDGTVYIGSRDRKLHAVNAKGKQKWIFKTGGWVDSSVAIGEDGTVYFGSWDKKFYALAPDGSQKWNFVTGGPVVSSPAIDADATIYVGSHDQKLYAFNPNGSKRWDFPTAGAILSSPAIDRSGTILITSVDGRLYAINPDGTKRWELRTGGITGASPAIGSDGAIQLGVNNNHCRITPEGKMQWQRGMDPRGHMPFDWLESTPAVLADGTILTTGKDLLIIALKPDGDWTWNFSLAGGIHASPVVGPDGTVYALNGGGCLYALKSSIPLGDGPWPMFRANAQHTGRVKAR
jgi:outer membrane protein assembly factor BamB